MSVSQVNNTSIKTQQPPVTQAPKTQVAQQQQPAQIAIDKLDKSDIKAATRRAVAKVGEGKPPRPPRSSKTLQAAADSARTTIDKFGDSDAVKNNPEARKQYYKQQAMMDVVDKHLKTKEDLKKNLNVSNTAGIYQAPTAAKYSVSKNLATGKYEQGHSSLSSENIKRIAEAMGDSSKSMKRICEELQEKYGKDYVTISKMDVPGKSKPQTVLKFKNGDKLVDSNGNGTLESKDFNLGQALNQMMANKELKLGELSEAALKKIATMDLKKNKQYGSQGSAANMFQPDLHSLFDQLKNVSFWKINNETTQESQSQRESSVPKDEIAKLFSAAMMLAEASAGKAAA